MNRKQTTGIVLAAAACLLVGIHGCKPLKEFYSFPGYQGNEQFAYARPVHDPQKKTVFIIADNAGTEMFDMMAPFYLFNATGKANVYLLAMNKKPVILRKGLFVLPQLSMHEADSAQLHPDLVVIPALSGMKRKDQDTALVNWIRKQYTDTTRFLSVCQGSLTAAATGLYNGAPITTHASEIAGNRCQYDQPRWVQDIAVTRYKHLYSTAGVSNAVEGSLTVIRDMFGDTVMQQLMKTIAYPQPVLSAAHKSLVVTTADKLSIARKVFFSVNKHIGVFLQDGVDELILAAVLDTYYRTFPASVRSFSANGGAVHSKYGLTLLPTGDTEAGRVDEWHVPCSTPAAENCIQQWQPQPVMIGYNAAPAQYLINRCLDDIAKTNGEHFRKIVERMLDYGGASMRAR